MAAMCGACPHVVNRGSTPRSYCWTEAGEKDSAHMMNGGDLRGTCGGMCARGARSGLSPDFAQALSETIAELIGRGERDAVVIVCCFARLREQLAIAMCDHFRGDFGEHFAIVPLADGIF